MAFVHSYPLRGSDSGGCGSLLKSPVGQGYSASHLRMGNRETGGRRSGIGGTPSRGVEKRPLWAGAGAGARRIPARAGRDQGGGWFARAVLIGIPGIAADGWLRMTLSHGPVHRKATDSDGPAGSGPEPVARGLRRLALGLDGGLRHGGVLPAGVALLCCRGPRVCTSGLEGDVGVLAAVDIARRMTRRDAPVRGRRAPWPGGNLSGGRRPPWP